MNPMSKVLGLGFVSPLLGGSTLPSLPLLSGSCSIILCMSTANVAVGLVRDRDLDDGAEVHVAQGKAELQSSNWL